MVLFAVALAASHLMPLLGECDKSPANHISCESDFYKPVWATLHSDTGEVIKIDTASVELAGTKGATVFVYATPPHALFEMHRLRHLFFDCAGQFSDFDDLQEMMDAPPRSVAGGIAAFVCPIAARLNRQRIERAQKELGTH